jgi:hypothetical protein
MLNALINVRTLVLFLFVIVNAYGKHSSPIYIRVSTDSNFIPYNIPFDEEYEAFLKILKTNLSNSIPIAEYCVVYEKKVFCECTDVCDSDNVCDHTHICDSTDVYLRFEKILQEQPGINVCGADCSERYDSDFDWANKFLIHNDLKAKRGREGLYDMSGGFLGGSHGDESYCFETAPWHFSNEVPIYTRSKASVNLNKYSQYYAKGKIIPVEWKLYTKCNSSETTYSGKYFVRITGECPK